VSWFIKNTKPNTTATLSFLIDNCRVQAQWPIAFLYWKFDINSPVDHSSREATSNSAGQQTRRPLCNRKVHYRIRLLALPEEDDCCSSPHTLFIPPSTPGSATTVTSVNKLSSSTRQCKCCCRRVRHRQTPLYTGCPGRNGQNFGRVFLMLKYTDITQNTYIQSW